jgi:hypothetical protein
MAKDQKNLFKDAEALGSIKTGPVIPEPVIEVAEPSTIISDPTAFQYAIGKAQMEMQEGGGDGVVEVSKELFSYLVKNQKTPYLTYGNPGVKVYLEGTREKCEIHDSLSAEDAYSRAVKERSQKVNSVV